MLQTGTSMPGLARGNRGFSLLDALLAVIIVAVGFTYLARALISANQAIRLATRKFEVRTIIDNASSLVLADIVSVPFDTTWIFDGKSYDCSIISESIHHTYDRISVTVRYRDESKINEQVIILAKQTNRRIRQVGAD